MKRAKTVGTIWRQRLSGRSARATAVVLLCALAAASAVAVSAARPAAGSCDNAPAAWLACEDFEKGGLGWPNWFAQSPFVECLGCTGNTNDPARIQLVDDSAVAHDGNWSLYMPAEASAGYQGASLTYRSCAGQKRPGCPLTGHEQLYFRAWVRLAADHELVHHFLEVAGTRPNNYWESDGNAGCRPNGVRWAGTTLDFERDRQLFFYTYFPGMHCDTGNYCSGSYVDDICRQCATKDMACRTGPECCWGNAFKPAEPVILPRDRWVCLELGMHLNTPGKADGSMAFWVDDQLALDQPGMHWRDVADLQMNKAWLQHYIAGGDATQSNRIWFDDVVVSTERIGCGVPPAAPSPTATDSPTAVDTPSATAIATAPPTVRPPTATSAPAPLYLPAGRR